jgi:hypothetical protein
MGRPHACEEKFTCDFLKRNLKERHNLEDPRVGAGIILKCTFKKHTAITWSGVIWLRIRTNGRFLSIWE